MIFPSVHFTHLYKSANVFPMAKGARIEKSGTADLVLTRQSG